MRGRDEGGEHERRERDGGSQPEAHDCWQLSSWGPPMVVMITIASDRKFTVSPTIARKWTRASGGSPPKPRITLRLMSRACRVSRKSQAATPVDTRPTAMATAPMTVWIGCRGIDARACAPQSKNVRKRLTENCAPQESDPPSTPNQTTRFECLGFIGTERSG